MKCVFICKIFGFLEFIAYSKSLIFEINICVHSFNDMILLPNYSLFIISSIKVQYMLIFLNFLFHYTHMYVSFKDIDD